MSPEFDGSYENLINRLTRRDGDADFVSRAYEKAFTAHKGQFRQSASHISCTPLGWQTFF